MNHKAILKPTLFLLILFGIGQLSFARTDKLTFTKTSQQKRDLILVWGGLKYKIKKKKNTNWDTLFLHLESKIENGQIQTDDLICSLLEHCNLPKLDAHLTLDTIPANVFSWVDDLSCSTVLKNQLKFLFRTTSKDMKYYQKERALPTLKVWKDNQFHLVDTTQVKRLKLLSLARFWNQIQYTYPAKAFLELNWQKVLDEYIPVFERISNYEDYYWGIRQLTAELNDAHIKVHSTFFDPTFDLRYPPFQIEIINGTTIVTNIAKSFVDTVTYPIKIGDTIMIYDGLEINERRMKHYATVSGRDISYKEKMAQRFLQTKKENIYLFVKRGEELYSCQTHTIQLNRQNNTPQNVFNLEKEQQQPPKSVYYFDLSKEKYTFIRKKLNQLQETDTAIFDLRNYPIWSNRKLAKHLFQAQATHYSMSYDADYIGKLVKTKITQGGNKKKFKGKLMLLVNTLTISRGEYFASIFQNYKNSEVVGLPTAGANGDVMRVLLPLGISFNISGTCIFELKGDQNMQINGVQIDRSIAQLTTEDPIEQYILSLYHR